MYCFCINRYENQKCKPFSLNGTALVYSEHFKYLWHIPNNNINDNEDIMRQTGAIYASGNKIFLGIALMM